MPMESSPIEVEKPNASQSSDEEQHQVVEGEKKEQEEDA